MNLYRTQEALAPSTTRNLMRAPTGGTATVPAKLGTRSTAQDTLEGTTSTDRGNWFTKGPKDGVEGTRADEAYAVFDFDKVPEPKKDCCRGHRQRR